MKRIDEQREYTRNEAAELLGVNTRTIWLYIKKGILPAVLFAGKYRIKGADLKRLKTEGTRKQGRIPNRAKKMEKQRIHIDPDRVYTLQETAELLAVEPATVKKYVKQGKLTADIQGKRRLYFFKGSDITTFFITCMPKQGRPTAETV